MNNIVDEMELWQKQDRRTQIKTSLKDTRKALEGELREVTRDYLNKYVEDLENELKQLGDN